MPDIGPTGGGADAPLSLSGMGLPADLLSRLSPGESVLARVVRPLDAGRYLVNISGTQVPLDSRLELAAGQRLQLAVREAGAKLLFDLVPARSEAPPLPAATQAEFQRAELPARSAEAPAAPRPVADSPTSSPAARLVQVEAQTALARSAPLGEIVAEIRRQIGEPATAQGRPAAPGAPLFTSAGEAAPPSQSGERPASSATFPTAAPQETTPSRAPSAEASAPQQDASRIGRAAPQPIQPVSRDEPLVAGPLTPTPLEREETAPASGPPAAGKPTPIPDRRPVPPQLQVPAPAARQAPPPAPEPSAPAPSPPAELPPQIRTAAAPTPAPAQPSPGLQPAPADQALTPPQARDLSALLRELLLVIPEPEPLPAEPATAETAERGAPADTPAAAASAPTFAPASPAQIDALQAAIERLVIESPAVLTQLLELVEEQAAQVSAAMPEAQRLELLVAALDRLPPPPAPIPALEVSGTGAVQPSPELPPAERAALAALVNRLVAALDAGHAGRPEIPADLRTQLEQLDPAERTALRSILLDRERNALRSSPRLATLGRAHRALLAAQQRTALGRAGSLAASQPGANYSYLEIPTWGNAESGTARLRVLVRRDGGAPGGGAGPRSGRRVRAIMDLSLSALGEVWTEVILSGRQLGVRMELPDEERRDLIAAELPALEERLAARGFDARVNVQARQTAASDLSGEMWPEAAVSGRVDLWA